VNNRLVYWLLSLIALTPAVPVLAAVHHYQIAIDAGTQTLRVRGEFSTDIYKLHARESELSGLRALRHCSGRELRVRRGRISSSEPIRCFQYQYQIKPPKRDDRVRLPGDVFASSPSEWLWIPKLGKTDEIVIRLQLPRDVSVSVPWRQTDAGYVLNASPESGTGVVFFGNLLQQKLQLKNRQLRVTLIPNPETSEQAEKMFTWLAAAAQDVEEVSGAFPIPSPQVVVIASEPPMGGGAVPFGHVIRDGGESVRFYVNAEHPLEDFMKDWTATHEFAHLLLPYVRSKQKWVSEGFASYYQNILLARRGIYTEIQAWQKLHRAFHKAETIDNPPTPNNAHRRDFWEVRMLVYWSGAAMALLADTQLRELSGGEESLDTVLSRFQSCCLPAQSVWSAEAFFAKLDALTKYPVFSELFSDIGDQRGMPATDFTFARLGIVTEGEKVIRLTDDAPLANLRRKIMNGES